MLEISANWKKDYDSSSRWGNYCSFQCFLSMSHNLGWMPDHSYRFETSHSPSQIIPFLLSLPTYSYLFCRPTIPRKGLWLEREGGGGKGVIKDQVGWDGVSLTMRDRMNSSSDSIKSFVNIHWRNIQFIQSEIEISIFREIKDQFNLLAVERPAIPAPITATFGRLDEVNLGIDWRVVTSSLSKMIHSFYYLRCSLFSFLLERERERETSFVEGMASQ